MSTDNRTPLKSSTIISKYKIKNHVGNTEKLILYEAEEIDTGNTKLLKEYFPLDKAKINKAWRNPILQARVQFENVEKYDSLKNEIDFIKISDYLHESIITSEDQQYILADIQNAKLLNDFFFNRDKNGKMLSLNSLEDVVNLMINILKSIKPIHDLGYITNINTNNLLLLDSKQTNISNCEVKIIDLIDVFPLSNISQSISIQQSRFAPLELRTNRQHSKISFGSNIYSVASIVFAIVFNRYYDMFYDVIFESNGTQRVSRFSDSLESSYFSNDVNAKTIFEFKQILLKALVERYDNCESIIQDLYNLEF